MHQKSSSRVSHMIPFWIDMSFTRITTFDHADEGFARLMDNFLASLTSLFFIPCFHLHEWCYKMWGGHSVISNTCKHKRHPYDVSIHSTAVWSLAQLLMCKTLYLISYFLTRSMTLHHNITIYLRPPQISQTRCTRAPLGSYLLTLKINSHNNTPIQASRTKRTFIMPLQNHANATESYRHTHVHCHMHASCR